MMRDFRGALREARKAQLLHINNYKLASYRHDQCERSIHMHLFSMKKGDFTLIFILSASLAAICLMLGYILPKSYVTDEHKLSKIFAYERLEWERLDGMDPKMVEKLLAQQEQTFELFTESVNSLNNEMLLDFKIELDCVRSLSLAAAAAAAAKPERFNENQSEQNKSDAVGRHRPTYLSYKIDVKISAKYPNITTKNTGELEEFASSLSFESLCEMILHQQTTRRLKFNNKTTTTTTTVSCKTRDTLVIKRKLSNITRRNYNIQLQIKDVVLISDRVKGGDASPAMMVISQEKEEGEKKDNNNNERETIGVERINLFVRLRYTNASYTLMTILTRLVFLTLSVAIGAWYFVFLLDHRFNQWSIEQKWTALLFGLLIGVNRPTYVIGFLASTRASVNYHLLDQISDLTFFCALLLHWCSFAHSIRQMKRSFWGFYAPKLALIAPLWLIGVYSMISCDYKSFYLVNPISPIDSSKRSIEFVFNLYLVAYLAHLVYHLAVSALELKPISFIKLRFRIQLLLCMAVTFSYSLIVFRKPCAMHSITQLMVHENGSQHPLGYRTWHSKDINQSVEPERRHDLRHQQPIAPTNQQPASTEQQPDEWTNYLSILPQNHLFDSACSFLCFMLINNFYVLSCAYLYWPVTRLSYPMQQHSQTALTSSLHL